MPPTKEDAMTNMTKKRALYQVMVLKPFERKEIIEAGSNKEAMAYAKQKYGKQGWAEFKRMVDAQSNG
jgi:hypothetical protein